MVDGTETVGGRIKCNRTETHRTLLLFIIISNGLEEILFEKTLARRGNSDFNVYLLSVDDIY